jgi:hypothetical protein
MPQPVTPHSREAVLAALLALLDGIRGPVLVTVEAGEHGAATFRFPAVREPVPDADLTGCERDILGLVGEAGKRLTREQVVAGLEAAGHVHGESTVRHALANLTGAKKRLTNQRDGRGRGYGLAEWTQ